MTTIYVIYDDARMWIQVNYLMINEAYFNVCGSRLDDKLSSRALSEMSMC